MHSFRGYGCLFLLFSMMQGIEARNLMSTDAAVAFDTKIALKIKANGTYSRVINKKITILKESVIDHYQKFSLRYNVDTEKVSILKAYTHWKNKDYPVDFSMIEDKSLASQGQGFDNDHQISIPFRQVKPGATIYLKYQQDVSKVFDKERFSDFSSLDFGYWVQFQMKVDSALKLRVSINDPLQVLQVTGLQASGTHHLFIKAKQPFTTGVINEPSGWPLDPHMRTHIILSNYATWSDVATHQFTGAYETVLKQKLLQYTKRPALRLLQQTTLY